MIWWLMGCVRAKCCRVQLYKDISREEADGLAKMLGLSVEVILMDQDGDVVLTELDGSKEIGATRVKL